MKRMKAAMILLSAVLAAGCLLYRRPSEAEPETQAAAAEPVIYVQLGVSRHTLGGVEADVRCFKNENQGSYYFFLPSGAAGKTMRLYLEELEAVELDGKTVHSGERVELAQGEHSMTVNGETWPLVVMQADGIGSVFVETESGALANLLADKANREAGEILCLDENAQILYKGELDYMRGRGNSSWNSGKAAFRIKLKERADLFGLGAAKSFNMIPNAEDKTMLRNMTVYTWADRVGLAYSPQSCFADWYINGEYRGTYQLCESIGVDKERVSIADLEEETERLNELEPKAYGRASMKNEDAEDLLRWYQIPSNPQDISGGYLLELEIAQRYDEDEECSGFLSQRNQNVVLKSPACATKAQIEYISGLYQQMEDAVFSENGYNMATGLHYTDYIDLDSFAKKYLIEEVSKNLDAASTSQYFYKDRNEVSTKIFAGPVWDYDKALGNGGVRDEKYFLDRPEDLYAAITPGKGVLWKGLYAQPDFYDYMTEVFREDFLGTLEEMNLVITEQEQKLEQSAMMNAFRWNCFEEESEQEGKRSLYRSEVETMRRFLNDRCAWLEELWQ